MKPVIIQSFDSYIQANIAAGVLESNGISAFLQDENTVTINPVWTNAVGGIKLIVNSEDAAQAVTILKELEQEKKAEIPCPKCGSHNVEYIATPKPENWFLAILSWAMSGYAIAGDKSYHCFDCECDFEVTENNK